MLTWLRQRSVGFVVAPRPTSPTAWYWRSRVRPGICPWALSIARLARLMARSACRPFLVYCELFDSGAYPTTNPSPATKHSMADNDAFEQRWWVERTTSSWVLAPVAACCCDVQPHRHPQ